MSTIKLFVTHSPNGANYAIELPFVNNVVAGSEFQKEPLSERFYKDNTGDNISLRNRSYCELTTLYWAWKNIELDYYGFCHYRRLFSFSPQSLQRSRDCGVYPFEHLSERALQELCWEEDALHAAVEGYDFIIAQHINTKELGAKSVTEHWENASELRNADYACFLEIIKESCPFLSEVAQSFSLGNTFYPCNMFIAKRELLDEYCSALFDVLHLFEDRTDMSKYSIEGMRVTGHLAERFTGIYYEYLKRKGGYKLKELEVAFFLHATPDINLNRTSETALGVVFASDDNFVPYLGVSILSLCLNASRNRSYDVVVFSNNISKNNQLLLKKTVSHYPNFSLRFVDVSALIEDYKLEIKGIIDHVTIATYYRFLVLDVMTDYETVLYLDCDMLINDDVAKLFDEGVGDCLVGAVIDPDYLAHLNMSDKVQSGRRDSESERLDYTREILGMKDPYKYFQAGVVMFNLLQLRKVTSTKELMEMALCPDYIYMDQDILNRVCDGMVHYYDMSWNVLMAHKLGSGRLEVIKKFTPADIANAYLASRQYPRIIHYAGSEKPWNNPSCDFAFEYWNVARKTPFYEEMLYRMSRQKEKLGLQLARRVGKRIGQRMGKRSYSFLKRMYHFLNRLTRR